MSFGWSMKNESQNIGLNKTKLLIVNNCIPVVKGKTVKDDRTFRRYHGNNLECNLYTYL